MAGDEPLDEAAFSIDFFAVVLVRPFASDRSVGRRGTVLGRSRGEDGGESYAISFEDTGETELVARSDLEPTGERRAREDFYDGTRIRTSSAGELL